MWRGFASATAVLRFTASQTAGRTAQSSDATTINRDAAKLKQQPIWAAAKVQQQRLATAAAQQKETVVVDLQAGQIPTAAPTVGVTAAQLKALDVWNVAKLVRQQIAVRRQLQTCVVGGMTAIHRIWYEYGVRPLSVFVPNTQPVPSWCYHDALPSFVVRSPPAQIVNSLLGATESDAFAAHFPSPVLPPLSQLTSIGPGPTSTLRAELPKALRRVLVLHKLRIPSNVGTLLRAAIDYGFDAVVLDQSCEALGEKVLRASEGAVFSNKLQVYQLREEDAAASACQAAAISHRLLPLFAVPAQEAEAVFSVAHRFHYNNVHRGANLGVMLFVGSESQGLLEMQQKWTLPLKAVSLRLDNPTINSLNVAVAGSIMMHHFRNGAQEEFEEYTARGLPCPPQDDSAAHDDEKVPAAQLTKE